eukprot:2607625-Rhodomonas_salina.1
MLISGSLVSISDSGPGQGPDLHGFAAAHASGEHKGDSHGPRGHACAIPVQVPHKENHKRLGQQKPS